MAIFGTTRKNFFLYSEQIGKCRTHEKFLSTWNSLLAIKIDEKFDVIENYPEKIRSANIVKKEIFIEICLINFYGLAKEESENDDASAFYFSVLRLPRSRDDVRWARERRIL